jgi:hypothetical protein
VAQKCGVIEEN